MRKMILASLLFTSLLEAQEARVKLANVLPPLADEDDALSLHRRKRGELPIIVAPFTEHVRGAEERLN